MTVRQRNAHREQHRQETLERLKLRDPVAAYRFERCGKEGAGWWHHCRDNPNHPADYIPCSCGLRICPKCAEYQARRIQDRMRNVIWQTTQDGPPENALRFLTLTRSIPIEDAPEGEVRRTLDAAADLIQYFWGSRVEIGSHQGVIAPVENNPGDFGALTSAEIGENGHKIHAHCIIYGRYVDQHEISFLWEALTGDSIIDISRITLDKAIREVLKYVTKFTNCSPETLVKLHMELKGTRRVRTFGCFYNPDIIEMDVEATTQCPDCGAPMVYHSELDFEHWRSERLEEMRVTEAILAAKIAAPTLYLTEANKSPPIRGSPAQISYLDESFEGPQSLIP